MLHREEQRRIEVGTIIDKKQIQQRGNNSNKIPWVSNEKCIRPRERNQWGIFKVIGEIGKDRPR